MKAQSNDFINSPHRTILQLAFPALLSLIVEPLTGLVDTGFIAQLGAAPLAALGVGTTALSSAFWVFNFLGVGTQTSVAQALGQDDLTAVKRINGLALSMALLISLAVMAIAFASLPAYAKLLGAQGEVLENALAYMRIRLFGAPAVILTLTAMGTMRGLQDMRTPFQIAFLVNVLNILLDWPLIFGLGAFSGLGIAGAAIASTLSQWIGAIYAIIVVLKRIGIPNKVKWHDALDLLTVGRDLFLRTGLLILFFLFTTRIANQISPDSGAAHQAIRQVWILMALILEAFALTGQSLVGYFMGANRPKLAKKVASISSRWSVGTGVLLMIGMWLMTDWVITLFVPETAVSVFRPAWYIAALFQPINAIAFITDGLHWGTADYAYLRNGMFLATFLISPILFMLNQSSANALMWLWLLTSVWITIRAIWGYIRIWPGVGKSPYLDIAM